MPTTETPSHHLLRRRARARAKRLNASDPEHHYTVERAERGPWRWRVLQRPVKTT
jgi:hypothetical protein